MTLFSARVSLLPGNTTGRGSLLLPASLFPTKSYKLTFSPGGPGIPAGMGATQLNLVFITRNNTTLAFVTEVCFIFGFSNSFKIKYLVCYFL